LANTPTEGGPIGKASVSTSTASTSDISDDWALRGTATPIIAQATIAPSANQQRAKDFIDLASMQVLLLVTP
jgi:hypothetical protein